MKAQNLPYVVNLHPKKCNICGGDVIYTTNDNVYGKKYGSGYCYLCTNCGAYVGTHKPSPRTALGLLADEQMKKGKIMCHEIFDRFWKGKKRAGTKRDHLYGYLAQELGIDSKYAHFGYFDLAMLRKAYKVLLRWQKDGIDWEKIKNL